MQRLLEKYSVAEPTGLPEGAVFQAGLYDEQIELLSGQIRRIEKQLQPHLIPNPDVQRLIWIPGIGKLVASTLYLEIDGIERFATTRQFFPYCRVVPGADNSAGKRRHGRRKDGNRYLKLALSHAAIRAVHCDVHSVVSFSRLARAVSDRSSKLPPNPLSLVGSLSNSETALR